MPAARAASSISPDSRVSRMTSTRGASASDCSVAARPRARASSAVSSSPATPRTPSVPKSWRAKAPRLALAELRTLARLLEAGLLALLHARVAREEAAALELAAQVGIGLQKGTADAVTQGTRLRGHAAAVHAGDDVHARLVAHRLERLADVALQRRAREDLVERPAVDGVRTGARPEDDARDGRLALAGRAVARPGGEVDRDRRDGLVVGDVLGVVAGGLAVVVLVVRALAALGALHDEVDLEVGARDLRLLARSGLLLVVVDGVGGRLGGGGRVGGGRLGHRLLSRGGLLGRRRGRFGRGGLLGDRLGRRGLLGRSGLLGRRRLFGDGLLRRGGLLGGGGLPARGAPRPRGVPLPPPGGRVRGPPLLGGG